MMANWALPQSQSVPFQRHLVLVYRPGWQSPNDLVAIGRKVHWLDRSIRVFVVRADVAKPQAIEAASLPTLVVSFGPLGHFHAARGHVYAGMVIDKLEQVRRLAMAGVRVPLTTVLTPQTRLDPDVWGPVVLLKPSHIGSSSTGVGIRLMRTTSVRYRRPDEYPVDHPGRLGPMLAQRFIDTGKYLSYFRVLTLFETPLYCQRTLAKVARVQLDAPEEDLERAFVASQQFGRGDAAFEFVYDADVIATAKDAARAIPEVPLKGCDVVREERTGRTYVLEVNPGGNTWHFSSAFLSAERSLRGEAFERARLSQLDAFASAAHALVDRVNREAA